MSEKLIRKADMARMANRSPSTISKWIVRYEDFPKPVLGDGTAIPYFSEREFINWYTSRWPERAAKLWRVLHLFEVRSSEVTHEVMAEGPGGDVMAYMRAYRDLRYDGWKVHSSRDGFVATRDGTTHVMAIDGDEPQDWFVYEARIKATRREK